MNRIKKAGILLVCSFFYIAAAHAGDENQADKHKILALVNNVRAAGCNCGGKYFAPAPPVSWNNKLELAANRHTSFMQTSNHLSHTGENGSNAGQRITAAGYQWYSYGENIAAGYGNEEEVVSGWLHSPAHCKNIMNGSFKDMAVSRMGNYWTQDFASGEQ